MIRIRNLAVPFTERASLEDLAAKRLMLPPQQIAGVVIVRKAVDARRYHGAPIQFVYILDVKLEGKVEKKVLQKLRRDAEAYLGESVGQLLICRLVGLIDDLVELLECRLVLQHVEISVEILDCLVVGVVGLTGCRHRCRCSVALADDFCRDVRVVRIEPAATRLCLPVCRILVAVFDIDDDGLTVFHVICHLALPF